MTVLYVTHDQDEAFVVADRVAIMNAGRIVARGPAEETHEPARRRMDRGVSRRRAAGRRLIVGRDRWLGRHRRRRNPCLRDRRRRAGDECLPRRASRGRAALSRARPSSRRPPRETESRRRWSRCRHEARPTMSCSTRVGCGWLRRCRVRRRSSSVSRRVRACSPSSRHQRCAGVLWDNLRTSRTPLSSPSTRAAIKKGCQPMTSHDHKRLPLTAAVLAGGRSVRMGVDKTLLDVDGEPLVARVVRVVDSVCEPDRRGHQPAGCARRRLAARLGRRHRRRGRLPGAARRTRDGDGARRQRVGPRGRCRHAAPRAAGDRRALGGSRGRRRRAARLREGPRAAAWRSIASRRVCPRRARCLRRVVAGSSPCSRC